MSYAALRLSAAQRAERLALAMLDDKDVIEDLRLASIQRDAYASADAVENFRAGAPVWTVPATAPWMGF